MTAFGNASGVSLTRCAHQLRFQHEFEDMLQAVALGEADRCALAVCCAGQAGAGGVRVGSASRRNCESCFPALCWLASVGSLAGTQWQIGSPSSFCRP